MKYAKFDEYFLSYFRLDDNGETLVLTDKHGLTRAVKLLPYEERLQGDLISREALKKCAIPCEIHNGALTELCVPLYQINNAPTIDLKDIYQEGHYDGHIEGYTKAINEEKPRGEWIIDEDTIFGAYSNYKKCSICNEDAEWLDGGSQFLSKYCPNCGALMKGGAE